MRSRTIVIVGHIHLLLNVALGQELTFTYYRLGDLATCEPDQGVPLGVNDRGMAIGGMYNPTCDGGDAFHWFNGRVINLDEESGGDEFVTALSISRDGSTVFGVGGSGELVVFLRNGNVKGIGPPSGCDENQIPVQMNNDGTMGVGECRGQGEILGDRPAIYWIDEGIAVALEPLPGTPEGNDGYAMDVNDGGVVVGFYSFGSEGKRAFIWQDGVMTELQNALGGVGTSLEGISDSGWATGQAQDASGSSATMRYNIHTGVMEDLGGVWAALDINDRGDAAGSEPTDDGGAAATLFKDGKVISLREYLPSEYFISTSWGINGYGWIVGDAYDIEFDHVYGWLLVPIYAKGDYDGDGDVDLQDAGKFQECFAAEPYQGPEGGLHVGCSVFDFNDDADLDLTDYAAFQKTFTGPTAPDMNPYGPG